MKNSTVRSVFSISTILLSLANACYLFYREVNWSDFQFWLSLGGVIQMVAFMWISEASCRFKSVISNCIPLSIGFAAFVILFNLITINLISLDVEKIFYSGMLTMGLGLVATVFTLHGKRATIHNGFDNNDNYSQKKGSNKDGKLLMCLLIPLIMMLLSSIGLVGMQITPHEASYVRSTVFENPNIWPLIVLSTAFSAWIYVADLSLDTLNSPN